MTTVGKVKRYLLKDLIKGKSIMSDESDNADKEAKVKLNDILYKYISDSFTIEKNMKLKEDLNLDSLSMFELCTDIQHAFGKDILDKLGSDMTVEQLEAVVIYNQTENIENKYDIECYPLPKTKEDINFIKKFAVISSKLWNIQLHGDYKHSFADKVILCPNHESHLDALWIVAALYLNGIDIRERCSCMGAEYVMFDQFRGKGFRALGGIPVDRAGNPSRALNRACEYMTERADCVFIIHPEGTRTRDGKLGEFKYGAAELAIKTGSKVVPVCMNGAREIYPPDHKLPHIWGNKRLDIHIGEPVNPIGKSVEEITTEMRDFIWMKKQDFE